MNPHIFAVDPEHIAALTQAMRDDADAVPVSPDISVPPIGPLARFSSALHGALDHFDDSSVSLSGEARRLADVMDAMTSDAVATDEINADDIVAVAR